MEAVVASVFELMLAARLAEQRHPLERLIASQYPCDRVDIHAMEFEYACCVGNDEIDTGSYYWALLLTLACRTGAKWSPQVTRLVSPDQGTSDALHMKAVLSALYPTLSDVEPALGQEFGMDYTKAIRVRF